MLRKRVLSGSSSEDPDDPGTPETHDNNNDNYLRVVDIVHTPMNEQYWLIEYLLKRISVKFYEGPRKTDT